MKRQLFAAAALILGGLAAEAAQADSTPLPALMAWHDHADQAFAAARKSGKPVLVDLFAQWCGWCKTMEREVFNQPRFQTYAERFVLLRVDVEDGSAGTELQRQFRAGSLPTLLLLDPKQSLIGKIEGFMETERLIARLDRELSAYNAFLAAYDSALASTDPALWKSRAQELHARGDGGRAATLFERLVREGKLSGDELGWIRLQLADAYRMDGRFADAKKTASELRRSLAAGAGTPQGAGIAERVDLLLIFIAGGERDCTGAAGALADFERGHPRSPYLADARRAYSALKSDNAAQCS
ncbi:MAG: thioredoxin family protein [Thermoanaerobaculia bacterium]